MINFNLHRCSIDLFNFSCIIFSRRIDAALAEEMKDADLIVLEGMGRYATIFNGIHWENSFFKPASTSNRHLLDIFVNAKVSFALFLKLALLCGDFVIFVSNPSQCFSMMIGEYTGK